MASLALRKQQAFRSLELDVPIDHITYESETQPGFKTLDQKRVALLRHRFTREGCQPQTFPVLVLRTNHQRFICLNGKHRLEAGKLLDPPISRWAVLIYEVNHEDRELLILLRDGDSGLIPYCDGDIYRNIVSSQGFERSSWLAKLSPSKQKDVKRLMDNAEIHGPTRALKSALDRLLEFPGLWADLKIGCFHRLLAMHCPEELTQYLSEVYHCWRTICGGSGSLVTVSTVRHLEGKFPELSRADRESIWDASNHKMIFETAPESDRAQMTGKCTQLSGRVLSLGYFFEDTKLFEPAAKILRSVFDTSIRRSLRSQMSQSVSGVAESHWSAYISVWCHVLRLFPFIETDFTLRKDPKRPKPARRKRSATMTFQLAQHIRQQGFDTVQLRRLSDMDHVTPHILTLLDEMCPDADPKNKQSAIAPIRDILDRLLALPNNSSSSAMPAYQSAVQPRDEERCGMPFEAAFLQDSVSFTRELIYQEPSRNSNALYPSSFAVRADQIRCFLPRSEGLARQQGSRSAASAGQALNSVLVQAQNQNAEPMPPALLLVPPEQQSIPQTEQVMTNSSDSVVNGALEAGARDILKLDLGSNVDSYPVATDINRARLQKNLPPKPSVPIDLWRKGRHEWTLGVFSQHPSGQVLDCMTLVIAPDYYIIVPCSQLEEGCKNMASVWVISERGGRAAPWQFKAAERHKLREPLVMTDSELSLERLESVTALNLVLEQYPDRLNEDSMEI